jgi:hypothetical protein
MCRIVECWFHTLDALGKDDVIRYKDTSPSVKKNIVRTALIAEKLALNALRLHLLPFRGWK